MTTTTTTAGTMPSLRREWPAATEFCGLRDADFHRWRYGNGGERPGSGGRVLYSVGVVKVLVLRQAVGRLLGWPVHSNLPRSLDSHLMAAEVEADGWVTAVLDDGLLAFKVPAGVAAELVAIDQLRANEGCSAVVR